MEVFSFDYFIDFIFCYMAKRNMCEAYGNEGQKEG